MNDKKCPYCGKNLFPKIGDLLAGGCRFSDNGIEDWVEDWFNFPRYKVIGIYKNDMFLVVLDSDGKELRPYETMSIDSDQWKFWINK